uniref:Glycosyltransferase n=1 Tax=Lamium galeobdolon TaxID=53161 RepID=F8R894_LAMGA|nr:UDP-glucosyltransferase [Lamium galeobdolon]
MVFESHIGVVAFPFGTHAAPLLDVVQRIAASAPGTLFSFFNTADSNRKLFNTCANIRIHEVWDGTPRDQVFTGSHFEALGLFLKACPHNLEKAIGEAEEDTGLTICSLISDAFLWFSCDLAEKRGVPWVALWTSASCSLSAHMYTHEILQALESGVAERDEHDKIQPLIPGLEMATFRDLPPEVFLDKNPSPLAVTINKAVEKLPRSHAVILNSFEEIDPIIAKDLKSKFRHFLNIGPSILPSPIADDKSGCLSWLGKQTRPKSVVYISFSTVATPPEKELVALAEALEACQFPFLWSLKEQARESLPDGFLERTTSFGKIVSWAPQLQVLAHDSVGVFVSHCGWNSIIESISSGVPMICRPFFGDQKLNSRMIQDSWKIGLRIEGGVFSKSGAMEALNRIMTGDEGKIIRENVNVLKEKATTAVEPQGSSSKNFQKLLQIICI